MHIYDNLSDHIDNLISYSTLGQCRSESISPRIIACHKLKIVRFGKATVYSLDIHDLLVSKLAAGRLKDLEFVSAILK